MTSLWYTDWRFAGVISQLTLGMDWQLLAQAFNLIGCIVYHTTAAVLSLPWTILFYLGLRQRTDTDDPPDSAVFYEGNVVHIRRAPKVNKFRCVASRRHGGLLTSWARESNNVPGRGLRVTSS